jgi:hypothetical protein
MLRGVAAEKRIVDGGARQRAKRTARHGADGSADHAADNGADCLKNDSGHQGASGKRKA